MRHRDAHVPGAGPDQGQQRLHVHAEALLEGQVEEADVRLDGPRRLDVGGVVRTHDDEMVALVQQRRGDDEQGLGGARRDEHIVTAHAALRPSALRGDELAEDAVAGMVAVEQHHVGELQTQVREGAVAHRALREVEADAVVPQLLG